MNLKTEGIIFFLQLNYFQIKQKDVFFTAKFLRKYPTKNPVIQYSFLI